MAGQANIDDTEALQRLRIQIVKFVEVLSSAVAEAAGEVNRTAQWLELDRTNHWKLEVRKRHEKHQRALEALRMKQFYKGPSGERQSVVDEMKMVKLCKAQLEEAEQKQKAVAMHKNRLAREKILFQGALSRIGTVATQTGPLALAELKHLILALEKYGQLTAEAVSEAGSAAESETGMTRSPAEPGADGAADEMAEVQIPAQPHEGSGVDWDGVRTRALESRKRVEGEVVVEKGSLAGGKAAVWRDFLKGRIYIAFPEPPIVETVDAANWETMPSARLLELVVGLEAAIEKPGDRRVIIEEGRVTWND